ncbi:phosphoesterase [Sulfolobus sp. A20]|uniref:PHP-associated domain-containing protein n=1 Tax=Sulfolobaceae TaxID=118883 RepID=UPI0008460EE1|nr:MULTISPECIES: PHP domain-containing protein [unclassified Sulfolobus]TRM74585.1 PHP domain-containing protein [Sulfolobus sp. E5]TRM75114.1 PHP domain-containing protein [Sulfolobus sp. B5]TRM78197.1 PHP domain-containing protein [Sulfolobus sp. A20-N-F8]TRM81622.1 PHP domain-containing protein [Sulfolobus sp. D5]TRM82879.1 PHP domain-containing protein [Sulfolobus sp. A20-N-F6]TRM83257.1 PHP domain-containing protein [Sulfolobus sp. F3]TRM86409.1 PHP domain-containing protein [Sulfolobus
MFFDFHVHSFYSDGKSSPKDLIRYAKKLNIYIALTDHDTSRGLESVKEEKVIPGQEVTTQYGHVVILCSFIPSPPSVITELLEYARENSCVVFPSHPFDIFRKGIGENVYRYRFNLIEVYNSKAPSFANNKAKEVSEQLGLPGLANSDAHVMRAIGSAYNELYDITEFNTDEILDNLLKGKIRNIIRGLSFRAKLSIAEWYIQRKLGFARNTGGIMREM